ncbi:hypothetical protein BDD43_5321 [Mucilaginibacter gracilis]|uniref:Uncharacterized protein n=1 Tax=Mucilaginibacter gracilis TaxID=423350 RepID=A0A495J7V1_9SPHI|nr:hypothetical protein [Mucilaginibacter gracilis]RKR85065.1 hypothetical protein BDD43_5321 [Mucilaginibacter gracilis]
MSKKEKPKGKGTPPPKSPGVDKETDDFVSAALKNVPKPKK